MKLQIQGKNECFLATIAMLSGQEIETVRTIALMIIEKKSWNSQFRGKNRYQNNYENFKKVATIFQLPMLYGAERPNPGSSFQVKDLRKDPNVLKGKGSICIYWSKGGSHIMAFEDGKIFDPNGKIYNSFSDFVEDSVILYKSFISEIQITRIKK